MSGLSLGIDIGTSGVRTAVLDPDGTLVSHARAAHVAQNPDRIDADGWWVAVQNCLHAQAKALTVSGYDLAQVTRIGVDGTSGTMVLTDAALAPVTGALMYNSSGFVAEAETIARHAPTVHITQGANSALGRALRLQSQDPDGRAVHLLHQADFIIAKLRGQGGASDDNNALKLGYDPDTGRWPDWIGDTGLRVDLLPKPHRAGAPLGLMDANVARALGFPNTAVVHAGTTDSIAAFLAAAPLTAGASVTSLGTTLAIKTLSPVRIDDPAVGLYSHKLGDVWLVGGASNTGGGVLLHHFTPDQMTALSQRIDPDRPSDYAYYPLLKPGERFPVNDPNHPPVMNPRPDDDAAFLHGLFEGIARIEAQCYDLIAQKGGARPDPLFTAGGGAQNPVWTAIRARVLGVQPQIAAQSEASVGVARLIQSAS